MVDDFTRECLALVADTSLSGLRVSRELDVIIARRGNVPPTIFAKLNDPAMQGDGSLELPWGSAPRPVASPSHKGSNDEWTLHAIG